MAVAQGFRVARTTLSAATLTAILPPVYARSVTILNGTNADVQVHTNDNSTEYVVIAAGWERPITLHDAQFNPTQTAFWLLSSPGGLVVLLWF